MFEKSKSMFNISIKLLCMTLFIHVVGGSSYGDNSLLAEKKIVIDKMMSDAIANDDISEEEIDKLILQISLLGETSDAKKVTAEYCSQIMKDPRLASTMAPSTKIKFIRVLKKLPAYWVAKAEDLDTVHAQAVSSVKLILTAR